MLLRTIAAGLLAAAQVPEPSPPAEDAAIVWRAPSSCPDRGALVRGIEARLGRPLQGGELGIDGVVSVHPAAPAYRLRLRLRGRGPAESRTLSATTCAALADATAVLAVSALEARTPADGVAAPDRPRAPSGPTGSVGRPARREQTGPPPSDTSPTADPTETGTEVAGEPAAAPVEPEPEPPPVGPETVAPADVPVSAPLTAEDRELDAVAAAPPPPPRPALGGFVRLHAGPELGALPGISGAVGLATGLLWRRARLELQGTYLTPRTAVTAHGELRAWLAAAAVHGCARLGRGRLEVPLCGGLELGGMRGSARGVPDARATTSWWLAAVAGAGVAVRLGRRWSLWSALQLAVGLARPGFQVQGPGPERTLFASAPVTGRLLVGVELRLRDPR